jgi:hypothetical protein
MPSAGAAPAASGIIILPSPQPSKSKTFYVSQLANSSQRNLTK